MWGGVKGSGEKGFVGRSEEEWGKGERGRGPKSEGECGEVVGEGLKWSGGMG